MQSFLLRQGRPQEENFGSRGDQKVGFRHVRFEMIIQHASGDTKEALDVEAQSVSSPGVSAVHFRCRSTREQINDPKLLIVTTWAPTRQCFHPWISNKKSVIAANLYLAMKSIVCFQRLSSRVQVVPGLEGIWVHLSSLS